MKIAYISDLHIEHALPGFADRLSLVVNGDPRGLIGCGFPDQIDADVMIIAGDVHPHPVVRTALFELIERVHGVPVLDVAGNHDLVLSGTKTRSQMPELRFVKDVSFGLATLWTQLTPYDELSSLGWWDMVHIPGMTAARWNELHHEHLIALQRFRADVVVTHHAPFVESTSDGYRGNPTNCFFINNRINPAAFPNTRLWVHGHVHQNHDYVKDGIHVVCNPVGYPFEGRKVQPKIIEI